MYVEEAVNQFVSVSTAYEPLGKENDRWTSSWREKNGKALANALAKEIKTQIDLNVLSTALVKLTVETALTAERSEHVG